MKSNQKTETADAIPRKRTLISKPSILNFNFNFESEQIKEDPEVDQS